MFAAACLRHCTSIVVEPGDIPLVNNRLALRVRRMSGESREATQRIAAVERTPLPVPTGPNTPFAWDNNEVHKQPAIIF